MYLVGPMYHLVIWLNTTLKLSYVLKDVERPGARQWKAVRYFINFNTAHPFRKDKCAVYFLYQAYRQAVVRQPCLMAIATKALVRHIPVYSSGTRHSLLPHKGQPRSVRLWVATRAAVYTCSAFYTTVQDIG